MVRERATAFRSALAQQTLSCSVAHRWNANVFITFCCVFLSTALFLFFHPSLNLPRGEFEAATAAAVAAAAAGKRRASTVRWESGARASQIRRRNSAGTPFRTRTVLVFGEGLAIAPFIDAKL